MGNPIDEQVELLRGSGNVFRDFGVVHADIEQDKAIVAARIIHILDERALSPRTATATSGYPHADFSRIRKADLSRFSLDKLVQMLNALDDQTEVVIGFRPGRSLPEAHQPRP